MDATAYELLSMGMRYWFAALGALIVLRAYIWLRKDRAARKRESRALPDAGMVGELALPQKGASVPLPHEGVLGSARSCDVRVRGNGIARQHLDFAFIEHRGVRIAPRRGCLVTVDGEPVRSPVCALHGSRIQVGDVTLRVRLFAGLAAPHQAQYAQMPDAPEVDSLGEGLPEGFDAGALYRSQTDDLPDGFDIAPYDAHSGGLPEGFGDARMSSSPVGQGLCSCLVPVPAPTDALQDDDLPDGFAGARMNPAPYAPTPSASTPTASYAPAPTASPDDSPTDDDLPDGFTRAPQSPAWDKQITWQYAPVPDDAPPYQGLESQPAMPEPADNPFSEGAPLLRRRRAGRRRGE